MTWVDHRRIDGGRPRDLFTTLPSGDLLWHWHSLHTFLHAVLSPLADRVVGLCAVTTVAMRGPASVAVAVAVVALAAVAGLPATRAFTHAQETAPPPASDAPGQ